MHVSWRGVVLFAQARLLQLVFFSSPALSLLAACRFFVFSPLSFLLSFVLVLLRRLLFAFLLSCLVAFAC